MQLKLYDTERKIDNTFIFSKKVQLFDVILNVNQ